MKLEDCRQAYYDYTGKASNLTRQFGFAGIALLWIFKEGTEETGWKLPPSLMPVAFFLVISLAMDFLQYISAAIIWGAFSRYKETSGIPEDLDFVAPRQINWIPNTFFGLKIALMVIAYTLLVLFLWLRFGG